MKIKIHKVEKDKCHKMPESLRGQQYLWPNLID